MHHEASTWSAVPTGGEQTLPRDTLVRLATSGTMPGAGVGELAMLVDFGADDRVFHVGDLIALLMTNGATASVVRIVGDVARDATGRWTMTGKLG